MRNEDWLRLSIPTVAFGLLALGFGLSERSRLSIYDETPQVLTCEQLGRLGPGDNIHVTLIDFWPCSGDIVVLQNEDLPSWHSAYVPVFPATLQAEPRPQDLRVVLAVPARNEGHLTQRLAPERLTGVVELLGGGRPGSVAQLLSEAYPWLDPERCLVLHVGRSGPSSDLARVGPPIGAGMMVLGLVGFGLGMVCHYRQAAKEPKPSPDDDEWSGDNSWREPLEDAIRLAARRCGVPDDGGVLHLLAEMRQAGALDEDMARLIGGVWSAGDPENDPTIDPGPLRSTAEQLIATLAQTTPGDSNPRSPRRPAQESDLALPHYAG